MKHPKRYCTTCDREEFLTIRNHGIYAMYHCRRCGDEVCRVGDGAASSTPRRVRGGIDVSSLSSDMVEGKSSEELASSNPDVLSDEHSMWMPRDINEEAEREDYLRTFKVALAGLTARQKRVLDAVNLLGSHERAATALGVAPGTIHATISQIAKKLGKRLNGMDKKGIQGKGTL